MVQNAQSIHALRRRIGSILRALRESATLQVAEAAAFLGWSDGRVVRLEAGLAAIRRADAKGLLELYGAAGEELLELVERTTPWWSRFSDLVDEQFETLLVLEEAAPRTFSHQAGLVPGLLQTREYSWELISTVSDQPLDLVDRRADLRQGRLAALDRSPAPELTVVFDEAALRRPVGGSRVMRQQYRHLLEMGTVHDIRLLVRPLSTSPYRATGFTFHIFDLAEDDEPAVEIELLDRVCLTRDPQVVVRYRNAFEQAMQGALSHGDSLEFLADLARRC
jgi:transcriptional regulator with XRE-family HTH domain